MQCKYCEGSGVEENEEGTKVRACPNCYGTGQEKKIGRGGAQRIQWDFVTDERLREMYEGERMSLAQMEHRLCVTQQPISRKLKEIGVTLRKSGRFNHLARLYEAFMDDPKMLSKPRKEIAAKFGCSINSVGLAKRRVYNTIEIYKSQGRRK